MNQHSESECEKASLAYLISFFAGFVALPLPMVNFFASLFYYLAYRKDSYFVKWHALQSMLSQLSVSLVNSVLFSWLMLIIFQKYTLSNIFIAFAIVTIIYNLIELIGSIIAAIRTRKGEEYRFFFFSDLTDLICKKNS
jgi:uncharacterized Tic20 family protein